MISRLPGLHSTRCRAVVHDGIVSMFAVCPTKSSSLYEQTKAALAEVDATLAEVGSSKARTQPLVRQLPRQPGHKEVRYAHLFSGAVEIPSPSAPPSKDRITRLEEELAALREEFDAFKKQFG